MISSWSFRKARISAGSRRQRRRDKIGEIGDQQLFRGVTDFRRVVDHERLRVQMLEQMRRRDILHIKGRVLPHQDDITGCQRLDAIGAEINMVADLIAQSDIAAAGKDTFRGAAPGVSDIQIASGP